MVEQSKPMSKLAGILLCLMCLGFMNQGTIIALILFAVIIVEKHGRIFVGNWSEFVTIILFAISFIFFGVIGGVHTAYTGILLPIGYCIGASFEYKESKDIDNVVLLMALSMDMHLILNLIYELLRYGFSFRLTAIHYDIWSGQYISSTGAMVNATAFLGCIYYLIFKCTGKKRICGISLLVVNTLYDLIMGGRSFLVILAVGIIVGFIVDAACSNGAGVALRKILLIGSLIAVVVVAGFFILRSNAAFQNYFEDTYFYKRFFRENANENIMTTGRTNLRHIFVSNMWNYPFGGRKIWNIAHQYAHELYLDIYDIGGIVPYILIIIFVVQSVLNCFKFAKSKILEQETQILLIGFVTCINLQFFIEPVLSGAPILLVVYCIFTGYIFKAAKVAGQMQNELN